MTLDLEAAISAGERAADDFREITREAHRQYGSQLTIDAVEAAKRLTMIAGAANELAVNLLILQEMANNRRETKAALMREIANEPRSPDLNGGDDDKVR